jgi:DNA helicase HerA-like ATPase
VKHNRKISREVIAAVGASGEGKTEFAVRLLNARSASLRFVFDPHGEFSAALDVDAATTPAQLAAHVLTGLVCFDPSALFPGERAAGFAFFAGFAFDMAGLGFGPKMFVADEVPQLCPQSRPPLGLLRLAEEGRKRGVSLVLLAQDPDRIPRDLDNQLTEVACFRIGHEEGLGWARKKGFDTSRIVALKPCHFIARNLLTGGSREGEIKW